MSTPALSSSADRYRPDGPYAYWRLGLSLLVATLAGAGMWAVIVVLPQAQLDFGVDRAAASIPYTLTMFGFAIGTLGLGRAVDRVGITVPLLFAAIFLGTGFVIAGKAPNLVVFSLAHLLLIGIGAGVGFAPLMADVSHWFVKRRGLAVVVVASGNYAAGALWPLAMNATMPVIGWRGTYIAIGVVVAVVMLAAAPFMRRRPSAKTMADADRSTIAARAASGISPRLLTGLLVVAGFSCCAAMAMPQVHIVAYCGDLGYGAKRGAEMLSLMLALGIISRLGSGVVSDAIGGMPTLLIGSVMQGVALLLYLFFDGLTSLFIVSGVFGLFQGGIVPMYAVICRELMPPREAGARIGIVVSATIFGMAFGGYVSGLIFDATHSYQAAFLNGVFWNAVNVVVVGAMFLRRRRFGRSAALVGAQP